MAWPKNMVVCCSPFFLFARCFFLFPRIWDKVSRTFWANVHFHKLTAKKCQHICRWDVRCWYIYLVGKKGAVEMIKKGGKYIRPMGVFGVFVGICFIPIPTLNIFKNMYLVYMTFVCLFGCLFVSRSYIVYLSNG